MRCLSLFSSVTILICLGLNALTPLAAMEFEPAYRYQGQPPNRLRAATMPETTASSEAPLPWYEKLPEWQSPGGHTSDAQRGYWPSQTYDGTQQSGSNGYAVRESISSSGDMPYNYFVRQQHAPVVGEAEPLPYGQHAFDSMTQQSEAYSLQQDRWDTTKGWDAGLGWGDRVRTHMGVHNAGCGTLWQGAADFYYLKRTVTAPITILVDDTTRSVEEFNAQSLGFGHNVGYGARLSRDLGCGASLNFGYFGLYDQQASIERTGDLALVVPGFATGGNPASYNSAYQSQLNSAEINIRQALGGRFGLLAGVRYINLNEDLLLSSQLGAVVTLQHYDINVNNNLFGAQFGADVFLARWGSLQLDAFVKCGFYLNDASQTTSSALIGPPVTASSDSFAIAGSAGIYATYWISDAWSVRAGYQMLGLNGIALAPAQLQQSNLALGNAGINADSTVLYGGGVVGLQYAW